MQPRVLTNTEDKDFSRKISGVGHTINGDFQEEVTHKHIPHEMCLF